MMATQMYILSYVIAIILILSNVKIVSANKNNQYATTATAFATVLEGTDDPVAVASTQQFHTTTANVSPVSKMAAERSAETKSISALHDTAEFIQHTLHNTTSSAGEPKRPHDQQEVHKQVDLPPTNAEQQRQHQYLVQRDASENPKQLLSSLSMQQEPPLSPHEKRHNHAQVIQQRNKYSDQHMNETKKTAGITAVGDRIAPANEHNQSAKRFDGESHNNNDSRKSDEINSMPVKTIRDNVNAASDAVFRVSESDGVTIVNKTLAFDGRLEPVSAHADTDTGSDGSFSLEHDMKFNERSRYLESDVDFNDELPEGSLEQTDVNANDQLDWPNDPSRFEELTLDEDDGRTAATNMQARAWTKGEHDIDSHESIISSTVSTHNIFKISKPNKSKSTKRLAENQPQAVIEIRLSKSPPSSSTTNEKQFINARSFRYVIDLYDQYEWNADDFRGLLSRNCANDMETYLNALVNGKTWATRASDASGRYRGQFLFENHHWLGSLALCNELAQIDEMDLSFFVATTLVRSPEPMIKKHILRVGQCLPRTCTTDDVKSILDMDVSARKFAENFMNGTTAADRAEISVVAVRQVPGDYNIRKDSLFYLIGFICIVFGGLCVWATIYENSLANQRGDENASPSRQAIHPSHISTKANGQRIYSYENGTIDLESTEPALKMDKIHANNIINGCTFELHPIEQNNGNHLANNNQAAFFRLNNNNANNINNNHHAGNNDDANDNNHSKRMQHSRNGSMYATKALDTHDANHLSTLQRLLLSFALPSNMKTILSMKKLPQESISCIHGLRVFSMMWTILVHTYLQLFAVSDNRYSKIVSQRTFWFQILGNASYTVDTFFFISGFLVTLLFLRAKSSTKSPNEGTFITGAKQSILLVIYRYIRLTPVYFMVIIINIVTLKYVYNDAVFTPGLPDHITCPNYWWRNILYIQTWYPFPQLCMLWAWYLADDMQFYIWAIVLLILSKRHGKAAVAIIVTFLLTSWVVSALVSLSFNYTHKISEPLESFGYLYEKPWTRLGPYVMGMIAGYILNRYKSAPAAITPFINTVLWLMSLGVMMLLVFGVWNGTLDLMWTAIYVSLGHSAWGLALVWIVLSCKWGLAKPIDRFLSLRGMLPLSRLTYCAYLVHPVTQIAVSLTLKGTVHINHSFVFTIFLGNVVISYSIALVLSLLFEAPIVRLLKILFSK